MSLDEVARTRIPRTYKVLSKRWVRGLIYFALGYVAGKIW